MTKKIDVQLPAPGESVKEVMVSRFLVEEGAIVAKDALLCEIESDKATMEVIAPESGKVHFKIQSGQTYPVGTIAVEIDPSFEPKKEQKIEKSPSKSDEKIVEAPKKEKIETTATNHTVRKGLESFLATEKKGASETKSATSKPLELPKEGERVEPMRLIRKTIAKRLVEVKNETAMLTTFNEVDMSRIMELRKQHQEAFTKKHGIKLGFMAFFTKAVERALLLYPKINAKIEKEMIVHPNGIHVGIAVSTDRGLVVPVVRHVEKKALFEVEKEIADLALKGRDGKLTIKDFEGGTFTITNGGVFGSMLSTPILNPPQSGILGMHATINRPVAIDNKVEIRPMMYLALSYDHRIVDGKEAVGFLVEVKRWIENPEIGVLNL